LYGALGMGVEQIDRAVCCTAGDHGIRWNRAFFAELSPILCIGRLGESILDSGSAHGR
jgi:hypothetical protein